MLTCQRLCYDEPFAAHYSVTVSGIWTHTEQRTMTTWAPMRHHGAPLPCMWQRSTVITMAWLTKQHSNHHEH